VLSAVSDEATQIAQQGGDFGSAVAAYLRTRPELTAVSTSSRLFGTNTSSPSRNSA